MKKIDYNGLINEAGVSVVRQILQTVAAQGLVQKQHLYIKFSTQHPDVVMSDILHEDFDKDMTIVLQYEFWDLNVDDYGFSVSLAFEHDDENLYIPFASIIHIEDPSENFHMKLIPNMHSSKNYTDNQESKALSNVISFDEIVQKYNS